LNLVSEWTFDNTSNIGEDTWGNNDGTPTGISTQTNNCLHGACLKIDAKSDYFKLNSDIYKCYALVLL